MGKVFEFEKYYDNIAAISDSGVKLTYKELEDYGSDIYKNINKRTLAFILCSNTIPCLAGYTSFINNNVASILLGSNIDSKMLTNLLSIYQPEYIWLPSQRKNEFKYKEVYNRDDYSLLITGYNTPELYDELALMVTTSGSTGSPKFVRYSYENIKADARQTVKCNRMFEPPYRSITTLQMNYIYAVAILDEAFYIGATILLTDKSIVQEEFWDFFKKEQATNFEGVPFMYETLENIGFYEMELPSLKYMTQSGGKLSKEVHKKIATYAKERSCDFFSILGSTEATGTMTSLPTEVSLQKLGSIGKAISESILYVVDEDGNIIENPKVEGELIFKGPNVSLGYAECRADLTNGDERHGEFATGDMGMFDEDGYFYITGRKKRFLKVYGHRVSLDEIDQMVKEKFGNIEFVSSGIDNKIYLFATENNLLNNIKKYLIEKTKLPVVAFKTVVIDKIPRNESGKIMFKELAKYYQ